MRTMHTAEMNGALQERRIGEFFSQLSPEGLREFGAMEYVSSYPASAVLFMEGDLPQGVYLIREGRVKLSICSSDGKKLILRIADAGELLDITAAMSGTPYEMTAETIHNCQVSFIRRDDFLRFLLGHPDVYQSVARELSLNYRKACEKLRSVVLSSSVSERLARLLLEWGNTGKETDRGTRVKIAMTHEEIGEFIGTSRETITRTMSDFKHRKFVMLEGSTLMISNRVALESFARG